MDSWTATSTSNAPSGRAAHKAVWAGNEMIVWGGYFFDGFYHYLNTGGRYNPELNSWTATTSANAPDGRVADTALWNGSEMIVWGGTDDSGKFNTGGRYDPGADNWTATSTVNVPDARYNHTAVWTGSEMIVRGGISNGYTGTGGRYCAQSGPTPTPTPTPTPCRGRCTPTPRPRPTPWPRP